MFTKVKNYNLLGLTVLILVLGATGLSVVDKNFRNRYGDIVNIALGAYSGQLIPEQRN